MKQKKQKVPKSFAVKNVTIIRHEIVNMTDIYSQLNTKYLQILTKQRQKVPNIAVNAEKIINIDKAYIHTKRNVYRKT
jgi:hypothetical protein